MSGCNVIIIGGEGDLAFRKLYPAMWSLENEGLLADDVRIVCFGRGKFDAKSFVEEVMRWIEASEYTDVISEEVVSRYSARLIHFNGDATSPESFSRLAKLLPKNDSVVYLSTPPSIFHPICAAMREADFVDANTRIVVEKPLGESRESFEAIDSIVKSVFSEKQIYRIDHYLGKETVQNLLALRFANVFFEPLWSRNYIDHIQITVAESIGVGGRWKFYEEAGALRDMVQNHLLQLLCLVSMEPPAKNNPDFVRDEKLKVLRCLKPIDSQTVNDVTVRGQYNRGHIQREPVVGYVEESDAQSSRSNTETFVAIKAEIENSRWQGVPFYLRTGKRLPTKYAEIAIQFKPVVHQFFSASSGRVSDNQLIIRLQPNEGIELNLINKVPGLSGQTRLQSAGLDLSFDKAFEAHRSPSAYERLLLDVIRSDPTLFMRSDEICAAWDWVDSILDCWETTGQPVEQYPAGSWGPTEAVDLLAQDRRRWFNWT
jgi:glucose-6-phosphate 1-dehydrogenase